MKALAILVLVATTGCSIAIGGNYDPHGPHPHVSAAAAVRGGPIELLHVAASNSDPVTDLTVVTLNVGPYVGPFQVTAGAGWQGSRLWGACDETGRSCEKHFEFGWVAAVGLTYYTGHFRADLKALSLDNSPVGANSSLPFGVETIALLFGFSP